MRVAARIAGKIAPAIEVDMVFQIGLPGILDGRLEGEHQHPPGPHLFCQLISRKRLAKAHLGVPQEAGNGVFVLRPAGAVIVQRLLHSPYLLGAHRKGFVMRAGEGFARSQFGQHRLHIGERAGHPFELGVGKALPREGVTHGMVGDDGAVFPVRRFVEHDLVVLDCRCAKLLGDALCHIPRCLADLQKPRWVASAIA